MSEMSYRSKSCTKTPSVKSVKSNKKNITRKEKDKFSYRTYDVVKVQECRNRLHDFYKRDNSLDKNNVSQNNNQNYQKECLCRSSDTNKKDINYSYQKEDNSKMDENKRNQQQLEYPNATNVRRRCDDIQLLQNYSDNLRKFIKIDENSKSFTDQDRDNDKTSPGNQISFSGSFSKFSEGNNYKLDENSKDYLIEKLKQMNNLMK